MKIELLRYCLQRGWCYGGWVAMQRPVDRVSQGGHDWGGVLELWDVLLCILRYPCVFQARKLSLGALDLAGMNYEKPSLLEVYRVLDARTSCPTSKITVETLLLADSRSRSTWGSRGSASTFKDAVLAVYFHMLKAYRYRS